MLVGIERVGFMMIADFVWLLCSLQYKKMIGSAAECNGLHARDVCVISDAHISLDIVELLDV